MRFSGIKYSFLTGRFAGTKPAPATPAAEPQAYPLSSILAPPAVENPVMTLRSIAMIGAIHDRAGNLWEDDVQLLENLLLYLQRARIRAIAETKVIPMSLVYDEDILRVQPKVDMAVLCYIRDDLNNEFQKRAKTSCRAQSPLTAGLEDSRRYEVWRGALVQTDAKIIASLGNQHEISARKAAPGNFVMVLDPEQPAEDMPPVLGKPLSKQKSYGIAARQDIASLLQAEIESVNTARHAHP